MTSMTEQASLLTNQCRKIQCRVLIDDSEEEVAGGEYINNIPNLAIILKSKFMWASFYAIDDFST